MDDPDNANFTLVKGYLHVFKGQWISIYYEYDASRASPQIEWFFCQELVEERRVSAILENEAYKFVEKGAWLRWLTMRDSSRNFLYM